MSTPVLVVAQSDSHCRQVAPTSNAAAAARLLLRGTGSSHAEQAFLHFTPPFPQGAQILSAILHLYRQGAWTATKTVNVHRVTSTWAENTINWNTRPATDSLTASSTGTGAGADGSEIQVDVTAIMQAVASGALYYGLRLDLTQDVEVAVRSSEAGTPALRPTLEVTWSETPDPPDRLAPDGGDALAETPRC